jgi:Tannase and feruloyl esterase
MVHSHLPTPALRRGAL